MKSTLPWLLSLIAMSLAQKHGEEAAKEMGPVAFLWPPDREWGAAVDNTAPCGSSATVSNRTEFPLVNGQIALVIQDESWLVQVGISYSNDPVSNDDFETVIDSLRISEVDPGHECYSVPNPPQNVQAGSNGTVQIRYTADFNDQGESTGHNETFYACADITLVPVQDFTYQVPCFNVSSDDFDVPGADGSDSGAEASSPSNDAASGSGLSKGAIAGIVVGVVVGVAIIAVGAFFIWRLRQQRQRLREQNISVRAVKWDQEDHSSNKSGGSIGLRPLSASK